MGSSPISSFFLSWPIASRETFGNNLRFAMRQGRPSGVGLPSGFGENTIHTILSRGGNWMFPIVSILC